MQYLKKKSHSLTLPPISSEKNLRNCQGQPLIQFFSFIIPNISFLFSEPIFLIPLST